MNSIDIRINNIEKRINKLIKIIGIADKNKGDLSILENIDKIEKLKNKLFDENKNLEKYMDYCKEFDFELKNFLNIKNHDIDLIDTCKLILTFSNDLEQFKNNYNLLNNYIENLDNLLSINKDSNQTNFLNHALLNLKYFNNIYENYEKELEDFIVNYSNITMIINDKMIKNN